MISEQMALMSMAALEIILHHQPVSNCTLGEMLNGKGVMLPSTTEKTPLVTRVVWPSSQIVCSEPSFISRIRRKVRS